jgi:hypothetical protein
MTLIEALQRRVRVLQDEVVYAKKQLAISEHRVAMETAAMELRQEEINLLTACIDQQKPSTP